MTEQKHDDACGASHSDAGLDEWTPLLPAFLELRKDAERYRWLANDCDGNAQDDFTRWLAGTVASKEDIDAKIDELMQASNASGKPTTEAEKPL